MLSYGAESMMGVSIVLCTLDRAGCLARVLADVVAQAPAQSEILVVDQSAGAALESTRALVRETADQRVRHLHAAPRGLPAARNLGIAHTSAPAVLFFDDDVRLAPGCIAAHLKALKRPGVGGVVGRIRERGVRPNAPATVNEITGGGRVRTNLCGAERVRVQTLKGANMSFRRLALDQAGGFDESYLGTALLEDADMSLGVAAAGWELWFEPEAELTHLSAPRGGVRQGGAWATERWRFHNTGYFVHKHRPGLQPRVWLTFSGIAAWRATRWREPGAPARLMGEFMRGWRRYSR